LNPGAHRRLSNPKRQRRTAEASLPDDPFKCRQLVDVHASPYIEVFDAIYCWHSVEA
jgi:hypothetical protein